MSSPERRRFSASDHCLSTIGALALAPAAQVIEYLYLPEYQRPRALVTADSLRTHQDTSERYSQRIAFNAWDNLSTCIPGTRAARRNQKLIVPGTPDFSDYVNMQTKYPNEALGYPAKNFSAIVEIAVENQKNIPGMGPTAANFLLDLAEVVEIELDTNE